MTDTTMSLRVADLRRACEVLLDEVERRFGDQIQLSALDAVKDHYWDLDLAAAYGMVKQPEAHLTAGQTSDDLQEIVDLLHRADGDEPVVLWHDLSHVSGVMRLLAYLDLP